MKIRKIPGRSRAAVRRVAAYCRVSTARGDQEDSYTLQKETYERMIRAHPAWICAGIYADGGRSGLRAECRPEFQRLMTDARAGRIDLILVKSISRFSRNLVECQGYVQELRSLGVDVFFEKERIHSMDASASLIFSLLAALAQDESRSISENVRWGYMQRYAQGKHRLGNNRLLGYDMDAEGKLRPNQDAWIVQMAFEKFCEGGMGYKQIAEQISALGGRRMRSDTPLTSQTVRNILMNEAYVGDRRLQKRPPLHFLTKKPDPNRPYQSYYLTDDHQAIVDRVTWEKAQGILEERRREAERGVRRSMDGRSHFLYGRVFCGDCGAPYMRRTLRASASAAESRHYNAWCCAERRKGQKGNGCKNRIWKETELLQALAQALGWDERARGPLSVETFPRAVERILLHDQRIELIWAAGAPEGV